MRIRLDIDGRHCDLDVAADESLMAALRRNGHTSVKDGCAHGDCGSCAVLVDGRAVTSCLMFAAQADGARVTTAAALASAAGLHPLQQALLDTGGVQCGFCIPGMLVTAVDLLAREPDPDDTAIREALAGNLCRCTGYVKQVEGIAAAARTLAGTDDPVVTAARAQQRKAAARLTGDDDG